MRLAVLAFDTFVSPLADRYRANGPPSMLHLTLLGLGYSAMFQGRPLDADDRFDEMSRVDVPERTFSVDRPIEARAAFRRGNRSHACAVLRGHVDDLLEADVMDAARLTALEFVTIMSALDRWTAGATRGRCSRIWRRPGASESLPPARSQPTQMKPARLPARSRFPRRRTTPTRTRATRCSTCAAS